jgi:hypothetical protein
MMSPDNLVFLGNFTGNSGWKGLGLIFFWTLFYIFISPAISPLSATGPGKKLFPVVLGFAVLIISTGILVSAGFAFNEIFVYWFPNFGFAFLLLALILGINLLDVKYGLIAQAIFLLLTLAPLLVLASAGLITGSEIADQPPRPSAFSPVIWAAPLLLWKGFDLTGLAPGLGSGKSPWAGVIVLGSAIFLLWALASLFHTPLEKLADTSLPHLKTARAILGDSGRTLMGLTIIFGTLGAVNALFLSSRQLSVRIWSGRPFFIPVFLASGIALMMVSGMAGSEKLEIWIQAVSYAWILVYALNAGAHALRTKSPAHFFSAGLIFLADGLMIFYSPDRSMEVTYIAMILASALIIGLFSYFIQKNKGVIP